MLGVVPVAWRERPLFGGATTSSAWSRAKANRDKSWCSHISCAAAMLPACLPQSHDPIFNAVILPDGRRHSVVMCPYVFRLSRNELAKVACFRV